jgi:prephenate dehydratase
MIRASKVTVWAATCEDRPGGMMRQLEGLARGGANLQFILSRRLETEPGKGVIFVSPITGDRQVLAAQALGFRPTKDLIAVRVEAVDEPGLAYLFASVLAREGLNLRGVSGMVVREQFVAYLALDTEAEAQRAIDRLQQPL